MGPGCPAHAHHALQMTGGDKPFSAALETTLLKCSLKTSVTGQGGTGFAGAEQTAPAGSRVASAGHTFQPPRLLVPGLDATW